jgi:hypothetical protein
MMTKIRTPTLSGFELSINAMELAATDQNHRGCG